MHIGLTIVLPTQWMTTHRLRGPGACQRSIDHPVLLDRACGSLPANVQTVGSGVENLDIPDGATLHCRARNVEWLRGRGKDKDVKGQGEGQCKVRQE